MVRGPIRDVGPGTPGCGGSKGRGLMLDLSHSTRTLLDVAEAIVLRQRGVDRQEETAGQ